MALGSTQSLTEMSTRNIFWKVKAASAYHLHLPIVSKCGNLNFLEPSGPVQACTGITLLLPFHLGTAVAQWLRRYSTQIVRPLVRFQMVSLQFFINIILPIALWSWGRLSL